MSIRKDANSFCSRSNTWVTLFLIIVLLSRQRKFRLFFRHHRLLISRMLKDFWVLSLTTTASSKMQLPKLTYCAASCKKKHFFRSHQCETAFRTLKEEIASDHVLVPFNPQLPISFAYDVSPTSIAAVLSQTING